MKTLSWSRALPGLAVVTVAFAAHADLSDRYVIDIHKADKAYAGTTIFADRSDPSFPVIVEVDMTGKVVWSYNINIDLGTRNDAATDVEWIPATDTILFTRPSGVYEVNRNKEIVWSHQAPASHDADRLPNGNTLFAWGWGSDSTVPEVREVDPAGNVVLLRRGIEPGRGWWAQPGGFLEVDETVTEAAIRETLEETGLIVQPGEIVGLYSRLEAAVVVIAFEAEVVGGEYRLNPEALEIQAFRPDAIPWQGIAFKTTHWALRDWVRRRRPDIHPGERHWD